MMHFFFISSLFLFLSIRQYAEPKDYYEYSIQGTNVIEYLPHNFKRWIRYPVLIALHGMKQSNEHAFHKWKAVADDLGYILVCPQGRVFSQGYSRHPIDDRRQILAVYEYIKSRYRVNKKNTVVVGFSRGGTIALELGVLYPTVFPNTLSLFGYMNTGMHTFLKTKRKSDTYKKSQFLCITGEGDFSEPSTTRAYQALKAVAKKSKLYVYPQLKHTYPSDLRPLIYLFERRRFLLFL